jgi:ComF family protein
MPAPSSDGILDRAIPLSTVPCISDVIARSYFLKDSVIQSIIHSFKYGEMPALGRVIGRSLTKTLMLERASFDLIIPVPLHLTREAERGFNQSAELAMGIADILNLPVMTKQAVRRIRPTLSQAQLSVTERLENVQGAFRRGKFSDQLLCNKRILLVDDVLTTGSTISAVAAELDLAFPRTIDILVFAAAVS